MSIVPRPRTSLEDKPINTATRLSPSAAARVCAAALTAELDGLRAIYSREEVETTLRVAHDLIRATVGITVNTEAVRASQPRLYGHHDLDAQILLARAELLREAEEPVPQVAFEASQLEVAACALSLSALHGSLEAQDVLCNAMFGNVPAQRSDQPVPQSLFVVA